jgi:hypothetical protein
MSSIHGIEANVVSFPCTSRTTLIALVYVRPNPPAGGIKFLIGYARQFGIVLSGDFNVQGSFNSQRCCSNPDGA